MTSRSRFVLAASLASVGCGGQQAEVPDGGLEAGADAIDAPGVICSAHCGPLDARTDSIEESVCQPGEYCGWFFGAYSCCGADADCMQPGCLYCAHCP